MCAFPLRRDLTGTELALAEESVCPLSAAIAEARKSAGTGISFAWISDLHIHSHRDYPQLTGDAYELYGRRCDTTANLRLALAEIAALRPVPDALILGGDLVDYGWEGDGELDAYDEVARILDIHLPRSLPTLPLFGNHDRPEGALTSAFRVCFEKIRREEWPELTSTIEYYYEANFSGWRVLVLDSVIPTLSSEQLAWLDAKLRPTNSPPTVVLIHRPFVEVGNCVDNLRMVDPKALDSISAAGSVRLLMSGHTHKALACTYRHKVHVVFPALAYGIGDACGWGCAVLGKEGVHSIFVKEVRGRVFESTSGRVIDQEGCFRKLSMTQAGG